MRNAPNKISPAAEADKVIEGYLAGPDIHDTYREKNGGFIALLLGFILCPLEYFLILGVIDGDIGPATGLVLHGIVTAVLALGTYLLRNTAETRFMILLLISVVTTGPFGAAGVALTVMIYAWSSRNALEFEEWFSSIFPKQTQMMSQRIHDDIIIGRDESGQQYSVISFMDVMSFGSESQKRQALSKAISNFHPNFAPLFRKALSDNSNTIRVLAATGISKIESNFLRLLMQLSEVRKQHGNDPLVVWALAEHYDNYAYTGLLDFDREQQNRQKALEYYNEYLKLNPQYIEPRNRIGRILMRNKEYAKACDWFHQCIAEGYVSDSISQWYSEALFNCGRYEDLRSYRAQNAATATGFGESLVLWAGKRI